MALVIVLAIVTVLVDRGTVSGAHAPAHEPSRTLDPSHPLDPAHLRTSPEQELTPPEAPAMPPSETPTQVPAGAGS